MATETLKGNDQSELPLVKIEPKEEMAVEIGIDDIFNWSDEETVPELQKQKWDTKEIDPLRVLINGLENFSNTASDNKQIEKKVGEALEVKDGVHFNAASNLQSVEQLVLNFGTGCEPKRKTDTRQGIINWADTFRTRESTDVQEELKKVIVTYAPLSAIEPHEITTLNDTTHICNHCQVKFRVIGQLRRHIRRLHREVTDMYQCPYCPYKSKWNVRSHILTHLNEKEVNWYKCHICDMRYKLKTHLTRHIYTHLSSAQLSGIMKQCSTCEKQFKTASALKTHIRFVHNKEKRVFKRLQCTECDYTSIYVKSLRNHIEVHHTNAKDRPTYECEKCDFKTTFSLGFKKHCSNHRTRYFCEKCGYIGSTAHKLQLHQITHEEKIDECHLKYRCDKCDYKTYRMYNLEIHKLNHLKPGEIHYFYCYHCDFKAKRKDNLKTHVLKHFKREEVNFKCFMCDFETKNRQKLINHMDKHRKAQTEKRAS